MGWIGTTQDCLRGLADAGADTDESGAYLIYQAQPSSFLGMGDELVIPDATEYSVNRRRFGLAEMLWHTKKGVKVNVL